ncbi:MAG TPA: tetratricopeptide repeat protein, partial [Chitinophagaceae bacterium]
MKILSTLIFSILLSTQMHAQTLDKSREEFYYQRYQSAEVTLHNILKIDPNNAEAWAMLMRTYIQEGKNKEASDSFSLIPEPVKQQPYFHIAAGALLLSDNNAAASKGHFEQAIEITKSKNIALLADIAEINIESQNGDYIYAIALLDKAIKKNKKNSSLYSAKGRAYRKLHNGTEAYKAFMRSIEINRHETIAYYELGKLFLSQKNKELYTEYFTKAIESDPGFGPAYYALYNHFLYSDPSKARDFFLQYLSNSDRSLQQAYSYTDLLYLTNNYDSAILRAQQLIRDEGDKLQPRIYKLISYSYQEKKDT